MDANLLNGLSLAYIGDAVYDLHKNVVKFTSGKAQAEFIHYFLENNLLFEDEISIFKRGRNSHVHTSRKNLDIQLYLDATGFEALIGYLYLCEKSERLNKLLEVIFSL